MVSTTTITTIAPTTTTNSTKEIPTTTLPAQTTKLRKFPKMSPNIEKSTLWPSTADGIHEFAWGKSKDADDSFTFSATPTPTPTTTVANIYIEYIKKEFSKTNEQGMKKDKGVSNQNEHTYEKPQHYIEKITQQKKKTTQTHTVIKKTHITVDEVEQHSGAGKQIRQF